MITPKSEALLRLHQHYQMRILPYEGGLLGQPNYYIEAMEIVELADRRIKRELQEREQRKSGGRDFAELMHGH